MAYAKTIVAVLAAVLAAILPGLTDTGEFGLVELANVVVLGAGALQVFNAPNVAGWRYAKAIAAAVTAGGVVLISAYSDSVIDPAEWVQIATAVIGAVGVGLVPNGVAARPPHVA